MADAAVAYDLHCLLRQLFRPVGATPLKRLHQQWRATQRGYHGCNCGNDNARIQGLVECSAVEQRANHLRRFFNDRTTGNGVWKWLHYFDIYERHFSRFRGQEVHVAEIGIFSGGSLEMWRDYFGPKSHIYGIDIEPACKAYERDGITVFIGDQADRLFWKTFCLKVPRLDIVIDDGGHQYEQQVVSLEELLPHLRPGGIYLCEDVHYAFNRFSSYVGGLAHKLNDMVNIQCSTDPERLVVCETTMFQRCVNSIHSYPFVVVVEKNRFDLPELVSSKRGTRWGPRDCSLSNDPEPK